MPIFLGIDTGGTYTDAVLLDDETQRIVGHAKALTTRPDLSIGIARAIDSVLDVAGTSQHDIALVSLSTTLATNALVEGQGNRVALILIGFDAGDRARAGLADAVADDPVITVSGGHNHAGSEVAPIDMAALDRFLHTLPAGVTAFAVAGRFATRNRAHELAVKDLLRARTSLPVTCSHELSAALNGPKRALTALLNARLISVIDRLIQACEAHLARRGIQAPLMAVRGDGALVSAALVRERPIETILSGPAASVAGAAWLTGLSQALVSDIGGTTTDICLLRDGKPQIDPNGARVGDYRTMVEAVAMQTTGLGGDSEIHVRDGLQAGLVLGPRRLMPISLAAIQFPLLVHRILDEALSRNPAPAESWRLAIALFDTPPVGLGPREEALVQRLAEGPMPISRLLRNRVETPALTRLVQRGLVLVAGATPSDAAHVLGRQSEWDIEAARKAMTLLSRQHRGDGRPLAESPSAMAQAIADQVTRQTVDCLLETAFAEDPRAWCLPAHELARHPITAAALDRTAAGIVHLEARLALPVVALGASAGCWYGPVGERLDCEVVVPAHAGVANAIGAVVGQVAMHADGLVTSPQPGVFIAHLAAGPARFSEADLAFDALRSELSQTALQRAGLAGVEHPNLRVHREDRTADVEGQPLLIEARMRVTASGRPRIATS